MAKKERQKRSARKARAAERKQLEEQRAKSAPASAPAKADASKAKAVKKAAPKKKGRIATWFAGVRGEMKRVSWPSPADLKKYSLAVLGMLVVFGFAVWLIDTGVVSALVAFSGLRG